MCGIAGIVSKENVDPADLEKMSTTLRHRGPDDEGFFLSSNGKYSFLRGNDTIAELASLPLITEEHSVNQVGLMHRRLSIIDLEPSGHQPMQRGKNTIVFNGEIYNYKEIRTTLEKDGFQFQTPGDTEVLLAAYEKWGPECVQHFVGMWAFGLHDAAKNQLFISRDRFGIKPLYYYSDNTRFVFASEIKALLSLDFIEPYADTTALLEYVSFGTTSHPSGNLFRDIQTLAPAHNLIFDLNSHSYSVNCYYDLRKAVANCKISSDARATFSGLLDDSISLHLRADVSVGSTLSGGLDSSTVVAMAARRMHGKLFKTFTAAYTEQKIDESSYARLVTDAIPNVEAHFAYPQVSTYWNDLEKITWHQDLPISSTSMFAQWEVMKLAQSQHTKVLLDGQGADEILGGYYNFAGIHLIRLLKGARLRAFFLEKQALKSNFAPNINNALGRAFFYFLPEWTQRIVRAKKRIGMGFVSKEYSEHLSELKVPERGGKSFREQSFLSMQFGLQDLLRYEDRNSMAFSIESRVPFLDHRLVEFCIALDSEEKIHQGWTKFILRKTADSLLDKRVTWRKDKMGFLTPQKEWFAASQAELKRFIETCDVPPILDRQKLLDVLQRDLNDSTHLSELWRIVSLLKWWQVFKIKLN